jgi:hypothetical protein
MPVETEDNRSDRLDATVGPVGEEFVQDRSDQPVTPVSPVNEVSVQTGVEVPVPS